MCSSSRELVNWVLGYFEFKRRNSPEGHSGMRNAIASYSQHFFFVAISSAILGLCH